MFQKTSFCFTNQMFYVRNILIRSYIINQITFIITTITTIITIIIIIIIIITIVIKSTIVIIIIILSFVLHFFDIKSLCVTFIFEFICVFLGICFLLFIGFRCNILLTNIYINLFLLALVFSKIFSAFNKQFSKFIMYYNFNCRLVLDLYILFQSFCAVLITQKF